MVHATTLFLIFVEISISKTGNFPKSEIYQIAGNIPTNQPSLFPIETNEMRVTEPSKIRNFGTEWNAVNIIAALKAKEAERGRSRRRKASENVSAKAQSVPVKPQSSTKTTTALVSSVADAASAPRTTKQPKVLSSTSSPSNDDLFAIPASLCWVPRKRSHRRHR